MVGCSAGPPFGGFYGSFLSEAFWTGPCGDTDRRTGQRGREVYLIMDPSRETEPEFEFLKAYGRCIIPETRI